MSLDYQRVFFLSVYLIAFIASFSKLIVQFHFLPYSKATSLDRTFPPAWIGYGNAFAAKEEGDQAMSAYRTAARLFPGY